MPNSTENNNQSETKERTQRADQAAIVVGLQGVLESDEQLLAFTRGKIAGGWRGKFAVGLEAFFAPDVNVGLTERRFILQHIHATTKTPSEILPHFFALADIANIAFGDIETFGGDPAGRLIMRLQDEQHFRVRLAGKQSCEDARILSDVFRSLTTARRKSGMTPTQTVCPSCGHILDQPFRFCPYCGKPASSAPANDSDDDTPDGGNPVGFEPPVPPSPPAAPEPPTTPTAPSASEPPTPPAAPESPLAPDTESYPDISYPPDLSEPVVSPPPHHTNGTGSFETSVGYRDPVIEDLAFPDPAPDQPVSPLFPQPIASESEEELHKGALPHEEADTLPGSPLPQASEMNAPTPATTAFWREFARISGVATPEAYSPSAQKRPDPEPVNAHPTQEEKE